MRTDWLAIQCRICNAWWGVVNADTEMYRTSYCAIFTVCPPCIEVLCGRATESELI